jgi:uncharacterized protein
LPANAERISIEIPDVGPLVGTVLPAANVLLLPGSVRLLGFGGNAWDADALALYLRSLFPDRDIVTFHYRGYGPSAGRPSMPMRSSKDAELIYDEVVAPSRRGEPWLSV